MNKIYDNGEIALGNVRDIEKYLINNSERIFEIEDILGDLKNLEDDKIVAINFDNDLGYFINFWGNDDIVKECE